MAWRATQTMMVPQTSRAGSSSAGSSSGSAAVEDLIERDVLHVIGSRHCRRASVEDIDVVWKGEGRCCSCSLCLHRRAGY